MAATQARKRKKVSFWKKYRIVIGVIVLVVILPAFVVAKLLLSPKSAPPKPAMLVSIKLPPPPPPPPTPPPPPPPPPKPEEKMIEQQPVKQEPKPEPPKAPQPAVGSAIKGSGNDGFGLSGDGNGSGIGGIGGDGGSRSKWGWYAGQVQQTVLAALKAHKLTRAASMTLTVRVWADGAGRIVKSTLAGSSGRADIDAAIRNEILNGLQLQEAPPAGMPMPIVMRISAKRPN